MNQTELPRKFGGIQKGMDIPSETLAFEFFKGMPCLLSLPMKRSVPLVADCGVGTNWLEAH